MKRADVLRLVEAALTADQAAYARQVAQRYLAEWPGDLSMRSVLARAHAGAGEAVSAVQILEDLTSADPEDSRSQRLLGDQLIALKKPDAAALAYGAAHVSDGLGAPEGVALPHWAARVRAAHLAERAGDLETARSESQAALEVEAPLPSLVHLRALWHASHFDLALPLAEGFHARWPVVIAFKLCLAECLLGIGQDVRALELLHDAASQDLAGQVAVRHWGQAHRFRALWADDVGAAFSIPGPLPGELIKALGLNRLPTAPRLQNHGGEQRTAENVETPGRPSNPESPDTDGARPTTSSGPQVAEALAQIQTQLDDMASRLSSKQTRTHSPGSVHYLILSSRTRLMQVFGKEGYASIEAALRSVAAGAAARTRMKTHLIFVDDPTSLKPLGVRPVNPSNAWDIKMMLADLATRLKAKGHALGAILIVGGPDIVPFHHLPNPTDDQDLDIPSDNPYATPDENYFVPEWPVGRIPSGAGNDPGPLVRALKVAAGATRKSSRLSPLGWIARILDWLSGRQSSRAGSRTTFGYSANIWKQASAAVYGIIGDPRQMVTSPPLDAQALPATGLAPSRLSYFNLHGIEDGPEWYGQRGLDEGGATPEYPVALRPGDVANSGRAPQIVFSEACYGANILSKTVEDALCLRFLESGSRVVVGSTKIAYGSVTTPLVGADLLGRCFWQNVSAGLSSGEALRRAKLQMAQEMHARQGFLDGEDQKTLISFVLYGDPTVTAPGVLPNKSAKRPFPKIAAPKVICDRAERDDIAITPETVAHIKGLVAQYLPGMQDAAFRVAHAHTRCTAKNHDCPTAHLGTSTPTKDMAPRNTVITLSKTIRIAARAHAHYARLTLDERGDVIKVAVSR
jgi:hypothetical protein